VGFLAARLLIAPNAAAELVKRLVDAGYISVTRDVEDRRRRVLALTAAGQTLLDRLSEAHLAEIGEFAPRLVRALRTIASRTLE
jgi:DNA-binding MarR family transcriptional regulator